MRCQVVVNAAVSNPSTAMGRTIHLQNPAPPVKLDYVADTLRASGQSSIAPSTAPFYNEKNVAEGSFLHCACLRAPGTGCTLE